MIIHDNTKFDIGNDGVRSLIFHGGTRLAQHVPTQPHRAMTNLIYSVK